MADDFTRLLPKGERLVWWSIWGGVFGYSFLYSVAADLAFVNDSRGLLRGWVVNNVEAGSVIEMTPYASYGLSQNYEVITRPINNTEMLTVERLQESRFYNGVLATVNKGAGVAREMGLCAPKQQPYTPWFLLAARNMEVARENFDFSVEGIEMRDPDYFITSSFYTDRFKGDTGGEEAAFWAAVESGQTSYELVKKIQYELPKWLRPEVEFVNPEIGIRQSGSRR
jgi:hypothetical protein